MTEQFVGNIETPMPPEGMVKPPVCAVEGCNNQALMLVHGKFICGECVMKINENADKQFWDKQKCQVN